MKMVRYLAWLFLSSTIILLFLAADKALVTVIIYAALEIAYGFSRLIMSLNLIFAHFAIEQAKQEMLRETKTDA